MKGYWRKPEATGMFPILQSCHLLNGLQSCMLTWHTAEIFVDSADGRWMRTGDIAYVNKAGHFYIVDRMKEYFPAPSI